MAGQAPHEAEPEVLGAAVLETALILAQLWGLLDGDVKRALRLVCRGVRDQVDKGAVQTLDAGDAGASELSKALACFPGVASLKAYCHSDGLEAAVISAAPLHRLKTLQLRYKGDGMAWSVPALSPFSATGLCELDLLVIHCYPKPHLSIEAVSSFSQLKRLCIHGSTVSDLWPLQGHMQLEELSLDEITISNLLLLPLESCVRLKKLSVAESCLEDLTELHGCGRLMTQLQELKVCGNEVESLEGLQAFSQLKAFSIGGGGRTSSLDPVAACVHLERLDIGWCWNVSDFEPLSTCANLKELTMTDCSSLSSLSPLSACCRLEVLNINTTDVDADFEQTVDLVGLEGLQACTQLRRLDMSNRENVSSLAPLSACVKLQQLNMAGCSSVSSLFPLAACIDLNDLDMSRCTSLSSVAPLAACAQLKTLNMRGCSGFVSVEPLKACVQLEVLKIQPGQEALKAALPRLRVD